MHDTLIEGTTVTVRGPRNHFPLVPASTYLFIAGGIGITPILPMIAEAQAAGADWRLLYGGRHRGSMAFFPSWPPTATESPSSPRMRPACWTSTVRWARRNRERWCTAAGRRACSPPWRPSARVGPREPAPGAVLGQAQEPPAAADESFELVLQQTGVTVMVPPDKTVFQAAQEAGANVLGSCMEGICGTCETEVVEGDVDHRDSVLNDEERASNEFMMICVSRCKSKRLVLDI